MPSVDKRTRFFVQRRHYHMVVDPIHKYQSERKFSNADKNMNLIFCPWLIFLSCNEFYLIICAVDERRSFLADCKPYYMVVDPSQKCNRGQNIQSGREIWIWIVRLLLKFSVLLSLLFSNAYNVRKKVYLFTVAFLTWKWIADKNIGLKFLWKDGTRISRVRSTSIWYCLHWKAQEFFWFTVTITVW